MFFSLRNDSAVSFSRDDGLCLAHNRANYCPVFDHIRQGMQSDMMAGERQDILVKKQPMQRAGKKQLAL
ncbi:MAG: hypothetical protein ACYC2W_03960 [Desulfurivibrionaceae bacterium]